MTGKNIYFTKKELERLSEIMDDEIEKCDAYLNDIPSDREILSHQGFNKRIRKKIEL